MGLTQEQIKAVESFGSNVLVSAGAGSGKTHVLTKRVLHFVKEGIKLDEFLILTFTKLAASEMRERIRSELKSANLKEALDVDFANIQTFDSFAYSLVNKYHFRLNLEKDVKIVDSNIINIRERKIVNDIFLEKYQANDPNFLNLIDAFCYRDDKNLINYIVTIYGKIKQEINFSFALNNILDKYSNEFKETLFDSTFKGLKEDIDNLFDLACDLPDVFIKKYNKSYRDFAISIIDNYVKANNYEDIIHLSRCDYSIPKAPTGYGEDVSKFKEAFKKFIEKARALPNNKKEFFGSIDKEKEYATEITEIIKSLNERITNYKYSNQAFEYNDISKMAMELVKNNQDVLLELKYGYKVIMIDEYQDTSLIQDSFIKLIENNNVYMVGDIKQSIYRFRDARCDIFIDKYNNYKLDKNKVVIDMNKNFRSRKEVLNNINDIFSMIMTPTLGGADYASTHKMDYGQEMYNKYYDPDFDYNLSFLVYSEEDKKNYKNEIEARLICQDILNKINGGFKVFDNEVSSKNLEGLTDDEKDNLYFRSATYKDFAILIDRATNFDSYKKVFEEYQIPIDIEKDEDIKNIDIVIFLKNLIKVIDCLINGDIESEEFKKSFLSISRSFVFEISDNETYNLFKSNDFNNNELVIKLKQLVLDNKEFDNYTILSNILYELDVYHKIIKIGDVLNNTIYLDYFLDNFKVMGELNYSFTDFYDYLCDLNDLDLRFTKEKNDNDINSVKLITIHKSKGLDYKILYLAGAAVKPNEDHDKIKYSSKYGLILPKEDDGFNIIGDLFNQEEKKEKNSERLRLLYVALTRAREKIIVLIENDEAKNNELLNDKEFISIDENKISSFISFIGDFIYYHKFNYYSLDLFPPEIIQKEVVNNNILFINELNLENEKIEIGRASHDLIVSTNKDLLKIGTNLHFLLEIMDFKNPDYSIIKELDKLDLIKSFIESPLMANVKDGKVFHEYEFIDLDNNINGIIDLMIEYNDHIDIIDYKTNNISDLGYIRQVNVYSDYIHRRTKKEVNGYLYSLVQKKYKKTN